MVHATERSAFEILSAALFHDSSRARSFMVMTGYFDESGTHKSSSIVLVAGFLANVEKWAEYEHDLQTLNNEYGVTKFHAKEWRQRKGDFQKWPITKRAAYNSRFLRLADDHLSCGFATLVKRDHYEKIYHSVKFPKRARPDTAYGLCFRIALLKSFLFARDRQQDWPVNIVVESGNKNIGDAIKVFDDIKSQMPPQHRDLFGYFSIGDKIQCPPLAVADALAYAVFRMQSGLSRHPTMPDVAAVVGPADPPYYVDKIPLSRTLIDENSIALLRDEITKIGPRLRIA
jgi:hypothetical protein